MFTVVVDVVAVAVVFFFVVVLRPRFFVLLVWVDSLLSVWFSFVLAVLVLQFGFYFVGLGG